MADDKEPKQPKEPKARKARKNVDPHWKPGEESWEPVPVRMEAVDWSYSEPEWFTPGANEKGQSTRMSHRVAPEMERAVEVLVASGRFPYKTTGDLIRHAIYRHLFFLHRLEPDADRHILVVIDGILQMLRDDEVRQRVLEMFSQTEARIKYHQAQGNYDEAVRIAINEKARLEASQPGHTRDRCMETLKKMMVPIARRAREEREKLEKSRKMPKRGVTMTDISSLPEPPEDDPED